MISIIFVAILSIIEAMDTSIIRHARSSSITLPFNQKMSYSRATPPQDELISAIDMLLPHVESSDDHRIFRALIYMSVNELDAAHDIVQRMSTLDALYIHALLHRLEGKHVGEANMKGWSNSDYWNDQVGMNHPNFPIVKEYACAAVNDTKESFLTSPLVNKFVQKLSLMTDWQPSLFLHLCMSGFNGDDADTTCVRYCEMVTMYEYRLLLEKYCSKVLSTDVLNRL
jgi:hypothetical protein